MPGSPAIMHTNHYAFDNYLTPYSKKRHSAAQCRLTFGFGAAGRPVPKSVTSNDKILLVGSSEWQEQRPAIALHGAGRDI